MKSEPGRKLLTFGGICEDRQPVSELDTVGYETRMVNCFLGAFYSLYNNTMLSDFVKETFFSCLSTAITTPTCALPNTLPFGKNP